MVLTYQASAEYMDHQLFPSIEKTKTPTKPGDHYIGKTGSGIGFIS